MCFSNAPMIFFFLPPDILCQETKITSSFSYTVYWSDLFCLDYLCAFCQIYTAEINFSNNVF